MRTDIFVTSQEKLKKLGWCLFSCGQFNRYIFINSRGSAHKNNYQFRTNRTKRGSPVQNESNIQSLVTEKMVGVS